MNIVVDTSLMIRLLEALPEDELLRRRLSRPRGLNAPHLIDAECVSALRGLVQGGKLAAERAFEMWEDFGQLSIVRHPMNHTGRRVLELRHNLSAYDAQFVVLAEALNCPLYTDDGKFAGSVGHSVEIWRPVDGTAGLPGRERGRTERGGHPPPAALRQNLR